MLDPARIMLSSLSGGFYESFYFRGTTPNGQSAFWLKHNLLRYSDSPEVTVECSLILFQRASSKPTVIHGCSTVPNANYLKALSPDCHWSQFHCSWDKHSWLRIGPTHLSGQIHQDQIVAEWNLQLQPSHHTLYHFPHPLWYKAPWPKKKILTNDIHLGFQGWVRIGDQEISGTFLGMNGHNWGREHAWQYAYANCVQFNNERSAYFDGLSVRLSFLNGHIHSAPLSLACLKIGHNWYRFDSLIQAPRQELNTINDYAWSATVHNKDYRLEINSHGDTPWVALHYDHPNHQRSVVKNTKFAQLDLKLFDQHHCLDTLSSAQCELETLMPWNTAGAGYEGLAIEKT